MVKFYCVQAHIILWGGAATVTECHIQEPIFVILNWSVLLKKKGVSPKIMTTSFWLKKEARFSWKQNELESYVTLYRPFEKRSVV